MIRTCHHVRFKLFFSSGIKHLSQNSGLLNTTWASPERGSQQSLPASALFKLFMLHSSLMRFRWGVLLSCKYLTAVCAWLLPEQTAVGLTGLLASDGGQHFSIFKALILNFTVSVLHFSKSDHVHTTDKCENAVYIWKFMSTLAFSRLFFFF